MEDDGSCNSVENLTGLDWQLVARSKVERLLGRTSLGVVGLEHLGRRSMGRGSVDDWSWR